MGISKRMFVTVVKYGGQSGGGLADRIWPDGSKEVFGDVDRLCTAGLSESYDARCRIGHA